MNTLQTIAKQPIIARGQFDLITDMKTGEYCSAWMRELEAVGAPPPSIHDVEFAQHTFYAWEQTKVLNKPVIVAAPPGFGKTTAMRVYLRKKVREQPDTFGAIVVTERLESLWELADYINFEDTTSVADLLRMKSYAYYIRGFDEREISREAYEAQFTAQMNYNIVIMTTAQFEQQALKGNVGMFSEFISADDNKKPRRLLLVDEKPAIAVPYVLTSASLNALVDDIRNASTRSNRKLRAYYRKALQHVNSLRQQIESPDIHETKRIYAVDSLYLLPRELISQFCAVNPISKLVDLRAFEQILRRGGLVSVSNGRVTVQSSLKLHNEWTQFNTFVLDGTGRIDPEYLGDDFLLMAPAVSHTYTNTTFHVCTDYNLSKSSIEGDKDSIRNIAAECRHIIGKHIGQVLIVTYKQYIDEINRLFADEIASGKVITKHFDGGRGNNGYKGADTAIYIGNMHKGSLHYPVTAQVTVGERLGIELSPEFVVNSTGLIFRDPYVENYKKLDMAVVMVQETNRLRANQKEQPVNLYVFNRDTEMIDHITGSYPGCTVAPYVTTEKLTGKKTAEDEIAEYFAKMVSGASEKQSDIYKALDIHRTTFARALATERVQRALRQYGITKEKTRFIKE